MRQKRIQCMVRLPKDMQEWLLDESNKNCRSLSMQIVYFLTQIKNNEQGNELHGSTTK